jgi:hypothetical protein
MVNLILWELYSTLIPTDPVERMKALMQMLTMVKDDVTKGVHSSWGMSPTGRHGYALTDLDGDKLFAALTPFTTYVKFTVKPMIAVDEAIAVMKQMQAQFTK